MKLLLSVILLTSLAPVHDSAKILYLPFPHSSAVNLGTWLEEDLHKLGHELWIAHPTAHAPSTFNTSRSITYTSLDGEDLQGTITRRQIQHFLRNEEYAKNLPDTYKGILATIQDLLHDMFFPDKAPRFVQDNIQKIQNTLRDDKDLIHRITKEKFDLVLVDHELNYQSILARSGQAFSYIAEYPDELLAGLPAHPGLTPAPGSQFTELMTLPQRLQNTLLYVARGVGTSLAQRQETDVMQAQQGRMWLVMQDSLIDYPRPSMPNVKYIGGMSLGKPKNLTKEVKAFYNKVSNVVVVSLGERIETIGSYYKETLFRAFAHTKYSFIVRSDSTISNPKDFLAFTNLDDIDLLVQSKTRLFVSSCDINSQYKAVSQGVPVLCIPTTRNLHNNALRLQNKGYGTYVLLQNSTADDIANEINFVLQGQVFKENVARAAKILHSKLITGRQEAAYWIDHVIQNGDAHFRSAKLHWCSSLCLDIALVYVTCIGLVIYLLNLFVKWSLPGFFRESDRRKEKSE